MSVVFSLLMLLLLLLLGFSSHACVGAIYDHHSINKERDEKLNSEARVSTSPMPSDATGGVGDRTVEIESDDHHLDDHGVKPKASSTTEWRVPHQKKGEVEPVFNLDYLPPKTHPPVHN